MSDVQVIPHHILVTLQRALVWCGDQITSEQRNEAWAWLDERGRYEEMGG